MDKKVKVALVAAAAVMLTRITLVTTTLTGAVATLLRTPAVYRILC